jgi:hypothetical protein
MTYKTIQMTMKNKKALNWIVVFAFLAVSNSCFLFGKRFCERENARNAELIISGIVTNAYRVPKDHNLLRIVINNKQVLHEVSFPELCRDAGMGDSIFKPKGSYIITRISEYYPQISTYNIEQDCSKYLDFDIY